MLYDGLRARWLARSLLLTAELFGCAPVDRASLSMIALRTWGCSFWLVGTGALRLLLSPPGLN